MRSDNQNSPSTTIEEALVFALFAAQNAIGYWQAGEEAVCFGEARKQPRHCSGQGGDGARPFSQKLNQSTSRCESFIHQVAPLILHSGVAFAVRRWTAQLAAMLHKMEVSMSGIILGCPSVQSLPHAGGGTGDQLQRLSLLSI